MRYGLRTLLILLAVGPPVLAWAGWIAREFYISDVASQHLYFRPVRWVPPFLWRETNDS